MATKLNPSHSILALDIGDARIGVARAGAIARLPEPLETIANDSRVHNVVQDIASRENVGLIVIGLPRNMDGGETAQSRSIREFAARLGENMSQEIVFADESLSSVRADKYLSSRKHQDVSQDSVAACYILEEFFNTQGSRL